MYYPNWKAGSKVTAALLGEVQAESIRANATQVVNNSTTLVDDTVLTVPVQANAAYVVEIGCRFLQANAAADLKTAWSVPSGATGTRMCFAPTGTAASFTSEVDTRASFISLPFTTVSLWQMGTADICFREVAIVVTSTTSGSITFQWAQNTATAANTTRQQGSYIRVQRFRRA